MKGFFDDWLRRPGYADFDATARVEGGGVRVDFKWNGPRFRMPLDVMFVSPSGRRMATVWLDGKKDSYFVLVEDRPTLISVDPWRKAVRKVAANEAPLSVARLVEGLPKFVDPKHPDWMAEMGGRGVATSPDDPAGKFIVGSPETLPAMRALCDKVGFRVAGNRLTYRGDTVDLTRGGALALVELGGGKRCVIGLGKTRLKPETGRAQVALVDELGRFLRGETAPKTSGKLVIKL